MRWQPDLLTELEALRQRCAELEREVEQLRHQRRQRLAIAAEVHRSLIPAPIRHDRIWVDVRYVPVEDVGGDYCQVRFPDRATCYITMCDVTGHGIGPALLATRISSEVRYGIIYRREPRDIASSLERFLAEYFSDTGLFLTFVAARIDLERGELTWSGAGHPSPLLVRRDGRDVLRLTSQNPLVGLGLPNMPDFEQETVAVHPGDRLFFYTDGVYEVFDARGRQFGLPALVELARSAMEWDLFGVADRMLAAVGQHQHGPTADDQTLVVAEMR